VNVIEMLVVVGLLFLSVWAGQALFQHVGWWGFIPAAFFGLMLLAVLVFSFVRLFEEFRNLRK